MVIRIPAPPPGLGSNLLGLAGLIGIAVAVGALAGNWWWTVGVAAVFAVALSWMAGLAGEQAEQADTAHQIMHRPPTPASPTHPNLNGAEFVPAHPRPNAPAGARA